MFEKTSELAERVATSVSRRHFLGALGKWAGATATGLAALLTAGSARAGEQVTCCRYWTSFSGSGVECGRACVALGAPCPGAATFGTCSGAGLLGGAFTTKNCEACFHPGLPG